MSTLAADWLQRLSVNFGGKRAFEESHYNLDATDELQNALDRSNLDSAISLIDDNADPNVRNDSGETALHVAVRLDKYDIAVELIAKGVLSIRQNDYGETPLHLAVKAGNPRFARLLVDDIGNVDITDVDGNIALHDAASGKNLCIVKMLINACADPYARNNIGDSPLDLAKRNGTPEIAAYIGAINPTTWVLKCG